MRDTLPDRVRLGAFQVDLRAGELREGERTTYLQEQPLFVLRMLVERAGELVTRDEIKQKLWPNDTVVDFDLGINAAIRRLRLALGDSADEPRYVETIARRGYRLLVPVEALPSARDNSPNEFGKQEVSDGEPSRSPNASGSNLVGKKVSHYRVLEVIGGGGMGMVYKAEDLKLGRLVALKFLPEELATDPVALQRFEREAKTASSLNHPNICTIHEVEEHEEKPFIVMELLEGETLRDRLATLVITQKRSALDELLNIAVQICSGLEAAHAKGIIHRDIKPANLFISKDGQAKILDFGVAKLVSAAAGSESDGLQLQPEGTAAAPQPARAEPLDATLTRLGVAMGTAGYMSPEQVRGEKVDARSDIFSFGLVLYEMATGQRAFTGETAALVHDAIVNQTPTPLHELNSKLPPKLVNLIEKALEKDREQRYQSAEQIREELERVGFRDKIGGSPRFRYLLRGFALAAGIAAVVLVAALYRSSRKVAKLKAGDAVVVTDFENNTSDPAFKDALKLALETDLGQTPFLDVLGPDKARGVLKLMNRSEDERLTPAIAQQVCAHTNSAATVIGSITDEGNNYRIGLKAINCKTGGELATAVADARTRDAVVKTLGDAGAQLRAKLGEPASSVQQFNKPLDEATSSSIEALQAFSEAERARMAGGTDSAIPFYKRAIDLDPNFPLACAYLGLMYGNLNDAKSETEYIDRAFRLRSHVTQRDRFAIEASYYEDVSGEFDRASQVYQEWLRSYPRDRIALINLGSLDATIGEHAAAAALLQEAIRLDPTELIAYQDLILERIRMGRVDEALAIYNDARSQKVNVTSLAFERFEIAFLQGDQRMMAEQIRSGTTDAQYEMYLLADQALVEAYQGRFRNARTLWAKAVDVAKPPQTAMTADILGDQALVEALVGNYGLAWQQAEKALALSTGSTDSSTRRRGFSTIGKC